MGTTFTVESSCHLLGLDDRMFPLILAIDICLVCHSHRIPYKGN